MAFALRTERLALRLRDRGDAEWNLELLGEHDPPGGPGHTLEEMRDRLTAQRSAALASGIGLLTIRRHDDGEPLGYCGLLVGRASLDEPEIGYELLRRHHGHGYATEAARAVVDAAAATGRTRLWSTVRTWNAPSLRVLEKLGFRRDRVESDEAGEVVYLVRELRDRPEGR